MFLVKTYSDSVGDILWKITTRKVYASGSVIFSHNPIMYVADAGSYQFLNLEVKKQQIWNILNFDKLGPFEIYLQLTIPHFLACF